MKKIPLSQGKFALVDDEDFEWLTKIKWYAVKQKDGTFYALGFLSGRKSAYMHRLINNTPDGLHTDHINRDKLDNRRDNLRNASHSQNQYNRKNQSGVKSSKYKGVHWKKSHNKWYAQIRDNGKRKYLGMFNSEREAALAYNAYATKIHTSFSLLNEVA